MDLKAIMEFDNVIRVNADGTVEKTVADVWPPKVHVDTDADGQISDEHEREMIGETRRAGWELLTGWTGQYHYHGPIMHASEFVGGALAKYILETPGLYCVVAVETNDDHDDAAGWAIAYRDES